MYLTRMELDTKRRNTMRWMASPSMIHGTVESAFSGARERHLWRMDTLNGKVYLLILSETVPDLTEAVKAYGVDLPQSWQSKNYGTLLDRVTSGSRWRFRLVANPTVSVQEKPGKRGSVKACIKLDDQYKWLLDRADRHGFSVQPNAFQIADTRWHIFEKGTTERHRVSLFSATYEGALLVTNGEKFKEMLTNGIGRGKAYGMGLMTIVRPIDN